jgi:late competence protein required for DNA uptake (superfamily II DNA/RNA helicase)
MKQDKMAEVAGIPPRTIKQYLQDIRELFPKLEEVDFYRQSRKALLETAESLALNSVAARTARDDAEDTLRDRAYAFDVMFKASRLERGVSTSNVETHNTHAISFTEVPLLDYSGPGKSLVVNDNGR